MLKVIIITVGLVFAAMLLLSVRLILKKDGRFSSQHISQSRAMRQRGIGCVNTQDRESRSYNRNQIDVNKL